MKIKYLILVSLILAIITIGAVSAADNADALAADDDTGDAISQVDEEDVVADGENPGDEPTIDEKIESEYTVDINDGDELDAGEDSIGVEIENHDATGNVSIAFNGTVKYNQPVMPYSYDEETESEEGGNYLDLSTLEGLETGIYRIQVNYTGDSKYLPFSENYTVTVIAAGDMREDVDYDVNVPEGVMYNSYDSLYISIISEISGNITIVVGDNAYVYNKKARYEAYDDFDGAYTSGYHFIRISELGLGPGVYNVAISYDGDENYTPFYTTEEMELYFMDVEIGEILTNDAYLSIYLANDATGKIEIFIDGASYKNLTAQEVIENNWIELSDLSYSNHTYMITYSDDEKYTLDEPFEGEFNLTYSFDVYVNEYADYYIGDDVWFGINVPDDAKGSVVITYNGKSITVSEFDDNDEYDASIEINDLNVGENEITFTYKNDDKYPESSIVKSVYVEPIFDIPETVRYASDDSILLVLPNNATGKLIVAKGEWNETKEDFEWIILANKSLTDGKVNYSVSNLPLGEYTLKVYYEGDDYDEYVDNETVQVNVIPNVDVPRYIYNATENVMKVVLPENASGVLKVVISSEDSDYRNETYNAVANGTVTIKIPNLDADDYQVYVTYDDEPVLRENEYSYFPLTVRNTNPNIDLNVTFPDSIVYNDMGDFYFVVSGIPDDAYGILELYINGKLFDEFSIDSYYQVGMYGLEYGENTWEIKFTDPYYNAASKSGTIFVDWIEIPETVYDGYEIDVALYGKEGFIELLVDGKSNAIEFLEGGGALITLKGLSLGTHTYTISYYDKNNVKHLTKSGSFNVTGYMSTNLGEGTTYPLTDEFKLMVYVPEDATGKVSVNVDGRNYTADIINGTAVVVLKDLVLGENNVTVTYRGDDKYPKSEIKEVLNITYYKIIDGYDQQGQLEYISILLPNDADGNLTLYTVKYIPDEGSYYPVKDELFRTVKLENGSAKFLVSDFKFGTYNLIACYESGTEDYEVEDNYIYFTVLPDIKISDKIIVGDNLTISINFTEATGNVSVYELIDENMIKLATAEIKDGVAEFNISGLKLGEHYLKFKYEGDDFILPFGEYDYDYDYSDYNPNNDDDFDGIKFFMVVEVLPKQFDVPETFNEDGSADIALELPEGSEGKITVYDIIDNGEGLEYVPIIENATYTSDNKTLSIKGLSKGDHELLFEFTDIKTGEKYSKEFSVTVPQSDVSKDVKLPESVSGDSFDVVLPKDATGGIMVTVDGNTTYIPLINGTAKVDVSKLANGTHTVTVKYRGDGNYSGFEKTVNIDVITPANSKISAPDEFNSDGSGVIAFELPEGSSGKVTITDVVKVGENSTRKVLMENVTYTSANKTIALSGLSAGNHTIELTYVDDKKGVFEFNVDVTVPKQNVSADVKLPETVSGDSFDVVLPKGATGGIMVTIDGNTTYVPLVNGTAKVDLSKLANGVHTVTVNYPGDDNYSGFEKTVNVTVAKPVDPKITAANLKVIYSAGSKYTVTVYGTDGKVAANTTVTFLINGKVFKTVTTDAKGIASVKITQKPGTYKITAQALGKSVVKTLTVKHILKLQKVKVKRSANKLVIKATLAKVNGKYLKGKKITLKFKNKKYTAKTNKKGVAKFTIKKSVLKKLKKGKKVTYKAAYLKDVVKYTVKVKK